MRGGRAGAGAGGRASIARGAAASAASARRPANVARPAAAIEDFKNSRRSAGVLGISVPS
jgi:hypothetical protein